MASLLYRVSKKRLRFKFKLACLFKQPIVNIIKQIPNASERFAMVAVLLQASAQNWSSRMVGQRFQSLYYMITSLHFPQSGLRDTIRHYYSHAQMY